MVDKTSFETLERRVLELEAETRRQAAVENELQYRLEFENLITSISNKFINLELDTIDAGIVAALERIGQFTKVDRSYLFRYNETGRTVDNTHEWCAPGITSHLDRFKNISLKSMPWLISKINAAQVVYIPDINRLPLEAEPFKRGCLAEGIKSLILVPTEFAGNVIGFMGLDAVQRPMTWSSDVIALLRIVGEIFASTLQRKHTEIALRRSEEKYRTILEAVEESYWEVNLKGDLTFFSPSLSRLLEYTLKELMGMNYRQFVTKQVGRKMYRIFNSIYRTGRPVQVTDFEHITKTGRTIVVEMSITLMRDDTGQPVGFRGVSRDVTDRKTAEQALLISEQRYRIVLESNPEPVIVYDINEQVIYFNPAFTEVFGWRLEELAGKKIQNFVPKQYYSETRSMAKQVMSGKSFRGIETQRHAKNGTLIPVSISGAAFKDVDDRPIGSVITIRDNRDKKKMETQLLNVHKMESLGTLAGGIAHDFNNLLMSIQGNLSLVMMDLDEGHPHYEMLENIEKNVESGSRLTHQLLGFSRKGKFELKPINLNSLVKSVSETFGRTRKEINIHYDLMEKLAVIEADEGQIEQVLLNLLVNAGQAMVTGGEIWLRTKNISYEEIIGSLYQPKPGNYVMLTVADTGIGMDKEILAHIFEPFFTTKEAGKGTGLGLASAYGIIKGHGGYIDVESEKGKGTTFFIYLPTTEKQLKKRPSKKKRIMTSGSGTLLLVDDEEMILEVSAKMLSVIGYEVITACGGHEAVDIFRKRHAEIDLVVLDVIMPNMNGSDVFDYIKQIDPEAKVLLLSGYSSNGIVESILAKGCNGFIQKPFNIKTISAKIREILSTKAATQISSS